MTSLKQAYIRRALAASALGATVLAAGCLELGVENTNSPSETDVFTSPSNLESVIGSTWSIFWGVAQGARTNSTYPVTQLSALGEETTSADAAIHEVIQEPRIPYNNRDAGQWAARKPWYDLYEVIANSRDALKSIENNDIKIGLVNAANPNGADTPRAKVFAKMTMALAHLYVGLMIDSGFVTDETTDPETFVYELEPYPALIAHGIAQLEAAIAEAKAAPTNFTLPATWINEQQYTRDDLVRIMTSYIVRGLVYGARTPAERAAVDWNRVLTLLDQGVTTAKPLQLQAVLSNSNTWSANVQRTQLQTNARADNRLLGPADTSGAYQRWLTTPLNDRRDFQIITPDRRIHAQSGPTAAGSVFGYLASQTMSSATGTYMHSRYRGIKWGTTYYQTGIIQSMNAVEMDFIRAEALYRLGRRADAVTIINKTRVANGRLPEVTVDGPPPGRACVPKKDDGSCGDLWDALMYEKRIETFGLEPIIPFADRRGWGLMLKGSLLHFPVTGRELQTLGKPVYTYGGDLPGSAP
jgi:hypothetical protein